ncbi:MAG: helicase-related protein [Tepidiforma sp.]
MSHFRAGTLVNARGRDWVVLPESDGELLQLRPLGGSDDEAVGLYLPLEGQDVRPATFSPPDPARHGDFSSARLLMDAVRLNFRSGAGPFRSLGRIGVEPRSYQVVPLLMALRQDPVRLLIADDVGIGKTIESALIARELLDRAEIRRLAVLCPPHLCEQWQEQLANKFRIDAEVVRPGTVARLERNLPIGRSLFEEFPFVVVSIDYIKSDRRRSDFIRACPEFVIVDEAHICAEGGPMAGGQQQRHRLVRDLASDPGRHLVLCTATPHSGVEAAFFSLLALLDPEFAKVPEDLGAREHEQLRRRIARHFVQRRRGDVLRFSDERTDFPTRTATELPYQMSPAYRALLDRVLDYATEMVRSSEGGTRFQQRVRWWAALALLRCVGSSPKAASVALRTRAGGAAETEGDLAEVDERGLRAVFDQEASETADEDDAVPGADTVAEDAPDARERRRLLAMASDAEKLAGDDDRKLLRLVNAVECMLDDGFSPIVFCRYVATADYVAAELAARLEKRDGHAVTVESVTGVLPPEVRKQRVELLGEAPHRVLVATDCLSEGIDLQQHFDAVIHYDLSWNPTRHEQRDGRVDRYGQPSPEVRSVLMYGRDNPVDGAVLRVIIRKAEQIRKMLGVSVPVPTDADRVLEAILETVLLRRHDQRQLEFEFDQAERHLGWDRAADREKMSRTIFAQHAMHPEEVMSELREAARALGNSYDVERFVREAAMRLGQPLGEERGQPVIDFSPSSALPPSVKDAAGLGEGRRRIGFHLPVPQDAVHIPRVHPLVEALANYLLGSALEGASEGPAARCAAVRSKSVKRLTTLLLLRLRFQLDVISRRSTDSLLAEECLVLAFQGDASQPEWLSDDDAIALLAARADADLAPEQRTAWLQRAIDALPALGPHIERRAHDRARALAEAHERVRRTAGLTGFRYRVEPHLPADVLGCYLIAPVVAP